jgi:hypothetical protein
MHEEATVKGNLTGSDATKDPERKLPQDGPGGTSGRRTCVDNPALRMPQANRWPLKADCNSPLDWWRTLPPDAFGDAERLLLLAALDKIKVLHGGDDFAAALEGDPDAAIGVAFSLMPIEAMTLRTDIAMTALLRCALEHNAAAALVLAQVLGLTDLGHPFATELATSWLAYGRRCSDNPRKFRKAETVLQTAFRERHRDGGDV